MDIVTGQFLRKIDDKRRFNIPRKILRQNDNFKKFVIAKSENGDHLIILPVQKWEEMAAARIKDINGIIPDQLRRWLGTAIQVKIDAQSRLRLDDYLVTFLHNPTQIVVVGVYDHYEVWEAEKWQNFIQTKS